jgi:putative membrane protein
MGDHGDPMSEPLGERARRSQREPCDASTGVEPDARFTFANERTFLAWNRTALALVAGGLAVLEFAEALGSVGLRLIVALPLLVLGGVAGLTSHQRYERNQLALRQGSPLPRSPLPRLLAVVIALDAAAAVVLAVVHAAGD